MTNATILEGYISVEATLQAGNRPIEQVLISDGKNRRDTGRLEKLAAERGVGIDRVTDAVIASKATGRSHGGILALAGERRFLKLYNLLPQTAAAFIVMLDGIEDPFNFGDAVRSLYAAGVDGIVVRPRNWLSAAGTVTRASAGASEFVPMAVSESANEAAMFFRRRGVAIACTTDRGGQSIYEADLSVPLFLLIGGEKRGITRSFRDAADLRLNIPYHRDFRAAMSTGTAAAVIGFELMRQRQSA